MSLHPLQLDAPLKPPKGTFLEKAPDKPGIWLSYGHLPNTVGRNPDSVAAYRRSIALDPGGDETWRSLANLKIDRFDDDDIAAMTRALTNLDWHRSCGFNCISPWAKHSKIVRTLTKVSCNMRLATRFAVKHFDQILPGKIHRVFHEAMVTTARL